MKELLFRNRLILYLGVSLRYFLLRVIRRRNVNFHSLLHGIKCPKDKEDETFNISNEFTNRLYAITFIVLIVIVIALVQKKSYDISVDNTKHKDSQIQKLHLAVAKSIKKAEASAIMRTPSNSYYFIQLFRDLTDEGDYVKFLLVTKNGQPAKNIILPSSEDIKNFSATIKQHDNKWCIIECQYGGGDNMYSRSFYFKCKDDDLYLYKCKAIGMHLVGDSYKKSSEKLKVQPISIMDFDTLPYLENTP